MIRYMTHGWAYALLAGVLMLSGCAAGQVRPQAAPMPTEAQVATYGRQVIGIADAVLTELDNLTEARLATAGSDQDREKVKAQARQAAEVIVQMGTAGKALATALDAWYVARVTNGDQKTPAALARQAMEVIIAFIPDITAPIDDPNIRAGVGLALRALGVTISNINMALPAAPA